MELIPPNAPLPKGKEVDLCIFVCSDHAGNKQIRRSRTRFMIYVNVTLINGYSKKQSTIETSVFAAEFVTMKVRVETLYAIWYKLRMMCTTISGHIYNNGDNMSIIHNNFKPVSTLKNKHNTIA